MGCDLLYQMGAHMRTQTLTEKTRARVKEKCFAAFRS